jgi:DNA-binding CsgD family transcriptional regulator
MGNQQVRNPNHVWKVIPFAHNYLVSEYGQVYSTKRNIILKTTMVGKYHRVSVVSESKDKAYLVHRLVAMVFLENLGNKPEVNHKDGNPDNNHVSNLEWVTREENQKHAFALGLNTNKGENNGRALMTSEKAVEIYLFMLNGASTQEAAIKYGLDNSTVRNIRIKKNWKEYLDDLEAIPVRKNNKPLTKDQVNAAKSLRYNFGMTCKQIAVELGISLGQAEGIFRSRATVGV